MGNTLVALKEIRLEDYLDLLNDYYRVSKYFDLYRLKTDEDVFPAIIKDTIEANDKLVSLIPENNILLGLEAFSHPILSDPSQFVFVEDEVRGTYKSDLLETIKISKKLTKFSDAVKDLSIENVLLGLISRLPLTLDPLAAAIPTLLELNDSQLTELLQATEEYKNKDAFKKLLGGLPSSYKNLLPDSGKEELELIFKHSDTLKLSSQIIEKTDLTLGTLVAHAGQSVRFKHKLNMFNNIGDELVTLTSEVFFVTELHNRYQWKRNLSIVELLRQSIDLVEDISAIDNAIDKNSKRTLELSTPDLVREINRTIEHNYAHEFVSKTFKDNSRYFSLTKTMEDYLGALPEITSLISDSKTIVKLWSSLDIPIEAAVQYGDQAKIKESIKHARESNLFSEQFFTVKENQDLSLWLSSISSILSFNNINELDRYRNHHLFIQSLKNACGSSSAWTWIEGVLNDEIIQFDDFTTRVVNSFVRTKYNSLPENERKTVSSDFFENYATDLKESQRTEYLNGLGKLKAYTYSDAKVLSNPQSWISGKSTMEKLRANTSLISKAFPIVIATPKEVAKYLAPDKGLFDIVVFDEASQLLPGQAIPSIFRAKRAVIVGDPHQMPPSLNASVGVLNKDDEEEYDSADSILDLAMSIQPDNQHHLKVHYRSESNMLFEPSRSTVYSEDGIVPIFEAQLTNSAPIDIVDNLGINLDSSGAFDGNFKPIVDRVNEYLQTDKSATFCILFTRNDVLESFKEYLLSTNKENSVVYELYSTDRILMSTVTNCQGIEGTYSIVYFSPYKSPGSMWFFKEAAGAYKRLNVAITRQRRGLCLLLADSKEKWLQTCDAKLGNFETGPNTRKSAELLKSLLENAGEVVDTVYLDKRLAQHSLNFDSPLTESLYESLIKHYQTMIPSHLKFYCEVGWNILIPDKDSIDNNRRNVGFRIDIGVYSIQKKKFILGIEMDGAAYHSGFDKEHSDYERQKVLEAKGWDIYRIWSTNWLSDQKFEMDKITSYIDKLLNTIEKKVISLPSPGEIQDQPETKIEREDTIPSHIIPPNLMSDEDINHDAHSPRTTVPKIGNEHETERFAIDPAVINRVLKTHIEQANFASEEPEDEAEELLPESHDISLPTEDTIEHTLNEDDLDKSTKSKLFDEIDRIVFNNTESLVISKFKIGKSIWINEFKNNSFTNSGLGIDYDDIQLFIDNASITASTGKRTIVPWRAKAKGKIIAIQKIHGATKNTSKIDIRQNIKTSSYEGPTTKGLRLSHIELNKLLTKLEELKEIEVFTSH